MPLSPDTKTCTKCGLGKPTESFSREKGGKDGLRSSCVQCERSRSALYRAMRARRFDEMKAGSSRSCSHCKQSKDVSSFHRGSGYCKDCDRGFARRYKQRNPVKSRETARNQKRKSRKIPLNRMIGAIRCRIGEAIRRSGFRKNGRTMEMIGCDWITLKAHLEAQFRKGMSWENYGEWHIDHRIPLASAKDEAELAYLAHYRNLQPLWAKENQEKSDAIPDRVQLHLCV